MEAGLTCTDAVGDVSCTLTHSKLQLNSLSPDGKRPAGGGATATAPTATATRLNGGADDARAGVA